MPPLYPNFQLIVFNVTDGGPVNNAAYNTIFRGMKFSHWEGGHRVPTFFAGPKVHPSLAGKWYNSTVHLVDLHATILDLAGVAASEPHGIAPVDGFTLAPIVRAMHMIS